MFASLVLLTVMGMVLYYAVELVQHVFVPTALIKGGDPAHGAM